MPAHAPTPRELVRTWLGDPGLLSIYEVERYKRVDCVRYARICLGVAAKHGWLQWHCCDCAAYEQRQLDERECRLLARVGRALHGIYQDS